VGPSAFAWVDRLVAAGQSWWQVLPLGPTGCGHSPYQALSSFAANELIISPDQLINDGILRADDCGNPSFPAEAVDFEKVIPFKERLVSLAWRNFRSGARPDLRGAFEQFCEEKEAIQDDAALFMTLRAKYQEKSFLEWPAELVRREPKAISRAKRELADAIDRFRFGQFIVLSHWQILKEYANQRGLRLLGDLPIFVSVDSSDVWAYPELFLLDEQLRPRFVAGVPPDYFSAQGQLWGNPVYNWKVLRQTGYDWWIRRLQARLDYLDAIRIDHFRGFEAAWHVPAGSPTAQSGQWVPGPGEDFFSKVQQALGGLPLLAEDLGVITPAVNALRDQFHLPGMRVLQFGFNGDPNNPHLPHHSVHNGVVYTGTHDNDTARGWYDLLPEQERRNFWNYLHRAPGSPQEVAWELMKLAWSTKAALAVAPFQDLLGLGSNARMNIPGRADGQWRWRCPSDDAQHEAAFQWLHELTKTSDRMASRNLSENNR